MKVWAVVSYSVKNNFINIEGIFTTRTKARDAAKQAKGLCSGCPATCRRIVKVKSVELDKEESVHVT